MLKNNNFNLKGALSGWVVNQKREDTTRAITHVKREQLRQPHKLYYVSILKRV